MNCTLQGTILSHFTVRVQAHHVQNQKTQRFFKRALKCLHENIKILT